MSTFFSPFFVINRNRRAWQQRWGQQQRDGRECQVRAWIASADRASTFKERTLVRSYIIQCPNVLRGDTQSIALINWFILFSLVEHELTVVAASFLCGPSRTKSVTSSNNYAQRITVLIVSSLKPSVISTKGILLSS